MNVKKFEIVILETVRKFLKTLDKKARTKIVFNLPESGQVKLEIYNIKGQKVKTLLDCYMSPGRSEMLWNSKDDNGKRVSSGVYFYLLQTPTKHLTKKMLLLK